MPEPALAIILGRAGTAWLALHQQTGEQLAGSGRINHWGFVVADFDTLQDRLESMGVPVLYTERWRDGVVEYPQSRSVYVADPDGNEIELTSAFGGGLS